MGWRLLTGVIDTHEPRRASSVMNLPLFVLAAQLLTRGGTQLELGIMSAEGSRPNDHPGHIPLDIENYPVAPSTLQLEQVYVFVRHGALQRYFA